jgi:TusA-related sulfurtransferase
VAEQRTVDGRGLMPPEPMELTLTALDALPDGEELLLLLYVEPHPLYGILRKNGYTHRSQTRPDGTVEIYIKKA